MKDFFYQKVAQFNKGQKVILTVGSVLFLIILFQLFASPYKKYKTWKGEDQVYETSYTIDSLQKLSAYKQALLKASSEDSIYMVISLPDSSLGIYVKGVNVFSTKVSSYSTSSFLSRLNSQIYQKQYGEPQKAKLLKSTIVKEPIKVKMAPKNAEEAALMATVPDSVIFDPAFISYELLNGTVINLSAEKDFGLSLRMRFFSATEFFGEMISALFHLEIKEFHPKLSLKVDNIDLTSVYRALPSEPYIIVRL